MQTSTTTILRAGSVLSILLLIVGCSSDPAAATDTNALKPAGCAKSECDVAHDKCMAKADAHERCGSCKDGCFRIQNPDFALGCVESCPCGSDAWVYESQCTQDLQACQTTAAARRCADAE